MKTHLQLKQKARQRGRKFLSFFIFKKLRVFHLLLILIAVMTAFLAVQGYTSISAIDSMQQTNQEVFNSSLRHMKQINTLREYVLYIKENYLKRLSKLSGSYALDYTFKNIESTLSDLQKMEQKTASRETVSGSIGEHAKQLAAVLREIKALAYAPDTAENFQTCESKLTEALRILSNIQTGIEQNAYQISTFSQLNSLSQKKAALVLLITCTVIAVIIGFFINALISWPLGEIIKSARLMAAGDFTQNIRSFGCKESHEVVQELNASVASLRKLIGNINAESAQITQAGDRLKSAAGEADGSAAEVAKAMQELAQAASNQTAQITHTAQTVNLLGDIVRKVSQETLNIASTSQQVAESARNGQKVTDDVAGEIRQIFAATRKIGEVIRELTQAARDIGEITTEIREIADQTTLLTLNASIEAARAGEHGKGFSVVANETGKLADRCKAAAQTIADRTVQMFEHAELAAQLMEQGLSRVEEGQSLANQATVTFEGIFNELKEVLRRINEVAQSAQEMSRHNEAVIHAVSSIAAVSQQSMAGTQEVSATAEEQSAAAQQVTSQAESLLAIANEMKDSAIIFKI